MTKSEEILKGDSNKLFATAEQLGQILLLADELSIWDEALKMCENLRYKDAEILIQKLCTKIDNPEVRCDLTCGDYTYKQKIDIGKKFLG